MGRAQNVLPISCLTCYSVQMLFLADFPDESKRHEGMSQRMITVDNLCKDKNRTYLFVSHRFYWRMETVRISGNATQYRCNPFRHFLKIGRASCRERMCQYV